MDVATQKQVLMARRVDLVGHMIEANNALDETPSKNAEERSVQREDDEVLEALGHAEQTEVRSIDAALGRIELGTYGECQKCGETISEARLELLPATPFCKNCAV